jgi:hypothetical protein
MKPFKLKPTHVVPTIKSVLKKQLVAEQSAAYLVDLKVRQAQLEEQIRVAHLVANRTKTKADVSLLTARLRIAKSEIRRIEGARYGSWAR